MIYEPFNGVFFGILAVFAVYMGITTALLRKKSIKTKKIYLTVFYAVGLSVFVIYKIFLINDNEYASFVDGYSRNLFGDLPLNPCNIVLWLTPIAVISEKRWLLIFCFFTSMIAAPFALVLPSDGFSGFSILTPRVIGFVLTHIFAISGWIYLLLLEIYVPEIRDIPVFLISMIGIAFAIYIVDLLLICSGLSQSANYFFSVYPENDIMRMMYGWIPMQYIYTLPAYFVEAVIALVITVVIRGIGKLISIESS